MASDKTVTAADVRSWAAGKGLAIAGARGRLSHAAIEAYNAVHKVAYVR